MSGPSKANAALLTCTGLRVGYAGRAILPALELELRPSELLCIIGRNGCGKTTLARTLLGLLPAVSGQLERRRDLRLAYLPQKSNLDEFYPLLARDVVQMGSLRDRSFFGFGSRAPTEAVESALVRLELGAVADRPYRELSEGQKQRVLFARLLASDPELAILDEPTSAMDAVAEREAFALLAAQREQDSSAFVMVTHDLELVRRHADRVLFVDRDAARLEVGVADEVLRGDVFRRRGFEGVEASRD